MSVETPFQEPLGTNKPGAALPDHCYYCFEVLSAHLDNRQPTPPTFPNTQFPLFVTWSLTRTDELRGCIGNFSAMPLHKGLEEYAIVSALQDTRFNPIRKSELANLSCGVSLLINFESGRNWQDWEIGKHGIRISFENEHGRQQSATYLPEVASEQGWDHKQTIDSLLRKGGFRGVITQKLRDSILLVRYQSSKIKVTYDQYQKHLAQ
ncbi:hypothetical protein BATDEDRAFT_90717 [Batrachochytrium dendrobatidis JAM81]|uniref:AMMECR1 domain-containing protein n=2 Tax=Batrachochytrium dendrobatidis TaxID=109871 RepID=F4P893_BATDJ|nr:uncharacterized protein BATDEDRAFT_90717 [Batrachochytrium dendrobatidis JAM81]EGF78573.1 hypothetical protein BATDEDRAFT_90717 [Batrachochytrium dendrobatidis JAM81]KAJ8324298.1 hypothetical protein O5D80_007488 [Batrachochytrium dendrobatidis]KAK5664652.1 hypothetical protein QVD99_008203 [Batrachochytrium dendrobatidis]OAJ43778.1 hypothetical protein BDEG_27098 [Batrachochytrium dendrobatidis JEL423]|eukprot:XP_006680893.1 hypothetical protein BATDEDRAFT_90717 [Batrachochytrium dendrobatidis JAM81]